jgi:hypothetical protein
MPKDAHNNGSKNNADGAQSVEVVIKRLFKGKGRDILK